jgi:hypothetical protein
VGGGLDAEVATEPNLSSHSVRELVFLDRVVEGLAPVDPDLIVQLLQDRYRIHGLPMLSYIRGPREIQQSTDDHGLAGCFLEGS